ncbi:MAG: tRNA (adenosine(37)-N6)-threonylcarbamoyltransferase complex ATPase subunit type 1 TsaE [Chlamydiales bacterium]|nr:tRNA (adenosine(37)-N6)-threonylcarbamoyltransferase complex ATPase subunit type 1 TsaE [Chlamydiales bacterium]NCF71380.1 tRNA (adenosine(37)-N6)-threonylcarbamoyltransferase complex ATPase subunit type 1 TsaE [Chlamydiales bacterium]
MPSSHISTSVSDSVQTTREIACQLAQECPLGTLITLNGDLGAGKTTFAKAFISSLLNIEESEVNSPTFTYLNSYSSEKTSLHHFDLYRLNEQDEFLDLGLEEFFYEDESICLVEWAEKISTYLPLKRWDILIEHQGHNKRKLVVTCQGDDHADI